MDGLYGMGVLKGRISLSQIFSVSRVSVNPIMSGDFEYTSDWNCLSLLTMLLGLIYKTESMRTRCDQVPWQEHCWMDSTPQCQVLVQKLNL